jgi:hypothetical protein
MNRKHIASIAFALLSATAELAAAAPADWHSYLCTFGPSADRRLVKVNAKDERVKIDDRDMPGVRFTQNGGVRFDGPFGPWIITDLNGEPTVAVIRSYGKVDNGSCKVVDD